jgi:MFS family permease
MTGAQHSQRLALAWLILDLTGSVAQLGLMVFVMGVPLSLVALWGGVLADRFDRRLILLATQGFTGLNLALLAVLTATGVVEVWHVYVSSFGLGITQSLTMPARNALIRSLVGPEEIRSAVSLNAVQFQTAQVIWPAAAGGLISIAGVAASFTASAGLSVWGLLLLATIKPRPTEPRTSNASPLRDLIDGLQYSFRSPRVGPLMVTALMVGCLGLAYMSIAPGFARESLGFSAAQTGLLLMSTGIGAIIGSVVSLIVPGRDNLRTYFLFSALLGFSVGTLALVPWPLLTFLPAAGFGFCLSFMIVSGQTMFQTEVPQELLGRVTSIWSLVGGIGFLSSLPIGVLGDIIGINNALMATGYSLFALVLVYGLVRTPVLRPARKVARTIPGGEAAPPAAALGLADDSSK